MRPPDLSTKIKILAVSSFFPADEGGVDAFSAYWDETLRGLSHHLGQKIHVLALRREGQLAHEWLKHVEIRRIDPPAPFSESASLDEPSVRQAAVEALSEHAASWVEEAHETHDLPVVWFWGSECALAASTVRRAGAHVVGVLPRLAIEEAMESLRATSLTGARRMLRGLATRGLQDKLLYTASFGARWVRRLSLPSTMLDYVESIALERRLLRASHQVISVGRHFAHTVSSHYPRVASRLSVTEPGVTPSKFQRAASVRGTPRVVLCVPSLPSWENDGWLEAWQAFQKKRPEWAKTVRLRVAANADPSPSKQLEWLNSTEWTEQTWREHLMKADALWLPSAYRPSSEFALTALSEGCLVLSAESDGCRDLTNEEVVWCAKRGRWRGTRVSTRQMLQRFASLPEEELRQLQRRAQGVSLMHSWHKLHSAQWNCLQKGLQLQNVFEGAEEQIPFTS